ncbi:MAG: NAD(P)-binding domain-containing protein [Planctomycetes bacterium]|nr:NAD(P)-binding domain-containing protein [Planctomycetota bacterium]
MHEVNSIAVIGAGTMGCGIALVAATNGIKAHQIDIAQEQLDRAKAYHAKTLTRSVVKQRMTQTEADEAASRISYHTDMADAGDADWAIEAVLEEIGLKKDVFRQMQKTFRDDVVFATNTSSISISDIAASVGEAAGRVIGMHFFNPVPVMKLVEVIKGRATSEQTTSRTMALAEQMGKTPIPANDRPGFVSNRVLMPMINEAFYAWMEGVAEPQHIDEIMKLGCSFPMGPLRLADYIGLDVCVMILNVMRDGLGSDKYAPCPKLLQLVEQGRLGDKTGRGVYEYSRK